MTRDICHYEGQSSLAIEDLERLKTALSWCADLLEEALSPSFDSPFDRAALQAWEDRAQRILQAIRGCRA